MPITAGLTTWINSRISGLFALADRALRDVTSNSLFLSLISCGGMSALLLGNGISLSKPGTVGNYGKSR